MEIKQVEKPSIVFVLGGPGSGKGTQSAIMVNEYNFIHFSTGDLLREFIKTDCEEAAKIRQLLREGKLAPSTMLVEIVKKKIFEGGPNNNVYLIDGFPRSVQNYEAWKEVMKDDVQVKSLLFLQCSQQTLQKRLLERGKTSGRDDDNHQTILKRFRTFKQSTQPLLNFYRENNLGEIHKINAEKPIQEVTEVIKQLLQKDHVL